MADGDKDRDALGWAAPRQRRARGETAYHTGAAAEAIVARHYERAGHPVRDRRWRGLGGEIDLVTQDGEGLIFVEVKKARSFARAAERISRRQIERIFAAATEYVGCMPAGSLTDIRFDLALVDGVGRVEILENAFAH